MNSFIRAGAWILVPIVLQMVLAPPVSAQDVATSFEQLRSLVKPGDTVSVTDASGRRTKGRLGEHWRDLRGDRGLIDAAITDRTTVYLSTGQRSSGGSVSPLLSKSAAGVQMSVRF